jgi:hypothetical protein
MVFFFALAYPGGFFFFGFHSTNITENPVKFNLFYRFMCQAEKKPEDRQERQARVIEREIISVPLEPAPTKKKGFTLFWKIAAGLAGLIAFLAALAAIFDSQTAKDIWTWLTGLFK